MIAVSPYSFVWFNALLYWVTFAYYLRKDKKIGLGHVLLLTYAISALFSILVVINKIIIYPNMELFPFLYLYIALFIIIYPFLKLKRERIWAIEAPNKIIFNTVAIFLVFISLIASINSIGNIFKTLHLAIEDSSIMNTMYENTMNSVSKQTGSSFKNIPIILSSMASEFILFLVFYYLTLQKRNSLLLYGLIISALIPVLSSISLGLRSMVVNTFLNVLFLYITFKPFYNKKIKKVLRASILVSSLPIIAFIVIITLGRFTQDKHQNNDIALYSVYSYAGQSFLNFNEYCLDQNVKQFGDNSFPLFRQILGLDYSKNILERQNKWKRKLNSEQGAFYSFIGDFCFDFGPIFTLLLLLIYSIFIYRSTKAIRNYPFYKLIILYLGFNIISHGVFYFSYKTIGGNLIIIFSFLMILLFKYSRKINYYA